MFEKGFTGMNYKSMEKVRSAIRWDKIAAKYGVKKPFKSVMRSLRKRGYVDDHGKSDKVYALTMDGMKAVR